MTTDYYVSRVTTTARGASVFSVVDRAGRWRHITVPARACLDGHADAVIRHTLATRPAPPVLKP